MKTKQFKLGDSLFSGREQQKINDALKLVDGVSHLTLSTDLEKAQEIKKIYGQAEENERK